MNNVDVIILVLYLLGMVVMGAIFSKIKSTKDMFNAGGQSPWWLSGISAFMTAFSAGTFVVWGGIAYTSGAVAISILMVLGISSILVGKYLAGRWKSFGYDSAAEFLTDRFGRSIVQFITLLQGLVGVFTMGGAVYALSVIICALIPMPEGHFLADPDTGNFSVTLSSLILCIIIILITSGGGLWAVLVTDAVQFIILLVSVLAVVPLMLNKVGGISEFTAKAPDGYFDLVNNEFSILFLVGWMVIYFFKFGGEWGFIQRFSCVPTEKDAKKSSYIFGILYLISPVIWMLPPMLFRTIDADINPEQAYIMACKLVLPAGMLGLMIAAMCSATASMVTAYLNVYAGAFTTEFYQSIFRKNAKEKELVMAGRVFTVFLGLIALAGAFIIPLWGTYTTYVLSSVSLLSGAMILPTIWGIFSKKLNLKAAWLITAISFFIVILLKLGIQENGWLSNVSFLNGLTVDLRNDERIFELVVGIFVPLLLLLIAELSIKEVDKGWLRIVANRQKTLSDTAVIPSQYPLKLCAISFIIVGVVISLLSFLQKSNVIFLLSFGLVLLIIGALILYLYKIILAKQNSDKKL